MSIILQKWPRVQQVQTANRCPQMASEKDARNMTFEAVQSLGWVITLLPKFVCVILMDNGHATTANYTTWKRLLKKPESVLWN